MQLGKFAAAARIASACISGWPEAPDWPLQSSLPGGYDGAGGDDDGPPNRWPMLPVKKSPMPDEDWSLRVCATATPVKAASRSPAVATRVMRWDPVMFVPSKCGLYCLVAPPPLAVIRAADVVTVCLTSDLPRANPYGRFSFTLCRPGLW